MVVFKYVSNLCCGENELMSTVMSKWFNKGDKDEEQIPDNKPQNKPQGNSGPAGAKVNKAGFTGMDSHYELVKWGKLPVKARKAAEALGFDENKWDNEEWAEGISDWHWHDLSEEQIKNVQTLGWTEEAWEHKYEHNDWAELPSKVRTNFASCRHISSLKI